MKLTQSQQVENYLNKNGASDNKTIANDLKIISHNVRRITGQSTLKGRMVRVSKGVYKLSEEVQKEYKNIESKVS
tara:strand:+ start:987 stop:1211 length:225 start_codon:yes stop_codon:yes gene_type:complete